jgi:hypothetical protein
LEKPADANIDQQDNPGGARGWHRHEKAVIDRSPRMGDRIKKR